MTRQTIFIALIFASLMATGQSIEDKAQYIREIMANPTSTIETVDTLNNYAKAIYTRQPDDAFEICDFALNMATKLNYTRGKQDALYIIILVHKLKSNLDEGIAAAEKYIKTALESNDSLSLGSGYCQKGNLLVRQKNLDDAEACYQKARNIYTALNFQKGLISVTNGLGILFKNKSMLDSAAFYYQQALKHSEAINFSIGTGGALINLGKVYMNIDEDSLAKIYFLQSININREAGSLRNVAIAFSNLGSIHMKSQAYDSALYFFDQASAIERQLGSIIGLNNLYINQGGIHIDRKAYSEALEKFNQALDAFSGINYPEGFITALRRKGEVLSRMGMHRQASHLFDSCIRMTNDLEDPGIQAKNYEAMYLNYKYTKNFEKALEYMAKYYNITNDITSQEIQTKIADMRMKYEKEKDQARILALTNENLEKDLELNKQVNQRNIFLFSGAGLIIIAIGILIFYRAKTKNDNYLAMQKIRQLEKDKKLISVQFLMEGQEEERKRIAKELHDGIGVLLSTAKMQFTSIDGISPGNRPKINNATKLLEMAASEVRKITHNMMPGLLSKYGFFEAVDDLMDQVKDAGSINTKLKIEGPQERFSENKEFMLYRMVQEMINNTIKHADATKIEISIKVEGHKLHLHYSDNGKGFDKNEKMNNKSIGLTSINSRANYLGGTLKLDTFPGKGTTYNLTVSIT